MLRKVFNIKTLLDLVDLVQTAAYTADVDGTTLHVINYEYANEACVFVDGGVDTVGDIAH